MGSYLLRNSIRLFSVAFGYLGNPESGIRKSRFGLSTEIVFGHSAFGAGVTVTIVETSYVGVKVGMVGRGVIDAVGVAEGSAVRVGVVVGSGDEVVVG